VKEPTAKELAAKEQAAKELAAKELAAKEKSTKDKAGKTGKEKLGAEKVLAEKAVVEKPVKEKAKEAPAVPQHPSRIWVQVGVGRDNDRILFDWRKLQRSEAELFKAQRPSISTGAAPIACWSGRLIQKRRPKPLMKRRINPAIMTVSSGSARRAKWLIHCNQSRFVS
jgi:hypothetical protein